MTKKRPKGIWVLTESRNNEEEKKYCLRLYFWPPGAKAKEDALKVAWAGQANEDGTRGKGTGRPSKVYDKEMYELFLRESAEWSRSRWAQWLSGR